MKRVLMLLILILAAPTLGGDPNTPSTGTVWYYLNTHYNSIESVCHIANSQHIDGVFLKAPNDVAADITRLLKQHDKTVVLLYDLWHSWNVPEDHAADLWRDKYYIERIAELRIAGEAAGADAVGLDTEPYGNSPMKELLGRDKWKAEDYARLFFLMRRLVRGGHTVNYILPAGSGAVLHPYHYLAMLGRQSVCESTYYNNAEKLQRIADMGAPWDIDGLSVAVETERPGYPDYPHWSVKEALERAGDIMIYPGTDTANDVAKAFREAP